MTIDTASPVMAATAAPGLHEIIAQAPLWVWPLLAALVWLGMSRTRSRTLHKSRVLLLPVVLTGIGLLALIEQGASLAAAAAFALAVIAGALAGNLLAHRQEVTVDDQGMVKLPGEYVSLALILTIFVARFAAGAVQSVNPALAGTTEVAVPLAIVSGFAIGLTGMRALVQTKIMR
jgi:hypothetical protein